MMLFTVISVSVFDRNDRQLFGFKMYVVQSDSMAATDFDAGDLLFAKEVDPSVLKEGDIITFLSQDPNSLGETVTHKIRKRVWDDNGNPGFVTYGTTTDKDDATVVTYPYILGKYRGHIAGLGAFFNFLKTPTGYFVCIFLPFLSIILYEGIKVFNLLRRYRGERLQELLLEKEQLEAEKAETARLIEELHALKAQLNGHPSSPLSEGDPIPTKEDTAV